MSPRKTSLLEVVVTARPSWARVKSLVQAYSEIAGLDKIQVSLIGPAISRRYGDISSDVPLGITLNRFSSLLETDSCLDVSLSSLRGAEALCQHWSISNPDCVLVIADRSETLGVSAAATLMQIPLIHLQGGEVSGSIDDIIRNANSKLADLHLTTNHESRRNLLNIGELDENIKIVGCPSIDLISKREKDPESLVEFIWNSHGVGAQFDSDSDFSIIMLHPDTLNIPENKEWVQAIFKLIQSYPHHRWLWFWPNTDHGSDIISKTLRKERESGNLKNVRFMINLEPENFIKLARKARTIVGNSSFGIREASFMGLPSLNLGKRQRGRLRGNNCYDFASPRELNSIVFQNILRQGPFPSELLYGDGNSGIRSAETIMAWTPRKKAP